MTPFKIFPFRTILQSNVTSICQPSAHIILNTNFIKSLLHVPVCYVHRLQVEHRIMSSKLLLSTMWLCMWRWLCHRTKYTILV